nr:hypothetical protein Iba_scaffold5726CG0030 [Ipomoea batatas]GME06921.1 hypothetical protein Iba_scaffold5727CG0010 [Ipomoea batatas]
MGVNRNQSPGMAQSGGTNEGLTGIQGKNGKTAGNYSRNKQTPQQQLVQSRNAPPGSGNRGKNKSNAPESATGILGNTGAVNRTSLSDQNFASGVPSVFLAPGRHAAYSNSLVNGYHPVSVNSGSEISVQRSGGENGAQHCEQKHMKNVVENAEQGSGVNQERSEQNEQIGKTLHLAVSGPNANSEQTASRTLGSTDTFSEDDMNEEEVENNLKERETEKEKNQNDSSELKPGQNSNDESEAVEQSEEDEDNRAEDDSESDGMSTEYEDMSEEAVLERLKILKGRNRTCKKPLSEGGGDDLLNEDRFGTKEIFQKPAGVAYESAVNHNGKTVRTLGDKEKINEIVQALQVEEQCETSNPGERGDAKNKKKDVAMNSGKQNTAKMKKRGKDKGLDIECLTVNGIQMIQEIWADLLIWTQRCEDFINTDGLICIGLCDGQLIISRFDGKQ